MVRSGPRIMVVESLTVLFAELPSLPPVMTAVLTANCGAVEATLTVMVIGGYTPPGAKTSPPVQVAVLVEMVQGQPVPLAAGAASEEFEERTVREEGGSRCSS